MGKLIYLFERLREPGSQKALMFIFGIFNIPSVQIDNWMGVLTLLFGAAAVFTPESLPEQKIKGFSK
ncbi:MAG: hypothetical protein WC714_28605 [Candidatus Obscuribacterales bacterium]|jgi:hypothetical protein